VWIAKTLQTSFMCGPFIFPSGFPHDFLNRLDSSTEIIFAPGKWRQLAAFPRPLISVLMRFSAAAISPGVKPYSCSA